MATTGASAGSRPLKILAFHGYTSNAFILQRRLGAIRKTCRDVAEFVFVNAPIRVEPITSSVQSLDAPEGAGPIAAWIRAQMPATATAAG